MSSTIWTRCAGAERIAPLEVRALRMVEAQHRVSTRKLVDDLAEQQVLEELIETHKPPLLPEADARLHYLLATPFRYPPLRHGSRFGGRHERGIWHGARSLDAVLAEVAFYRLLFLDDTAADLGDLETEHSLFEASVGTRRGVDLTAPPFDRHRRRLADPGSYATTQPLGTAMRDAGVQAFLFVSARDPAAGTNVAVLDPAAFRRKLPVGTLQTWHCLARHAGVVFTRRDVLDTIVREFPRRLFTGSDGRLARPDQKGSP